MPNAKIKAIRAVSQNTLATLEVYIRAHPFKSLLVFYGLGVFGTAGKYATQLMHAPLNPFHDPPSVPKNTPQLMYL